MTPFQSSYEVVQKLGKYSEVYEGVNLVTNEPAVLKFLKPIKVDKIRSIGRRVYLRSKRLLSRTSESFMLQLECMKSSGTCS